jgi:hypothetical protein
MGHMAHSARLIPRSNLPIKARDRRQQRGQYGSRRIVVLTTKCHCGSEIVDGYHQLPEKQNAWSNSYFRRSEPGGPIEHLAEKPERGTPVQEPEASNK